MPDYSFLAQLDTPLRPHATTFDPITRFYAILMRHVVVSDIQLLDNQFFRDPRMSKDLHRLFKEDSGTGRPFFILSKRNAETGLDEILLDLAGASGKPPIHFSSLSQKQRSKLGSLAARKQVTKRRLEREVGYPVRQFVQRLEYLTRGAEYLPDFEWTGKIHPKSYYWLLMKILQSDQLLKQVRANGKAKKILDRFRTEIVRLGDRENQIVTRSMVDDRINAIQRFRKRGDRTYSALNGKQFGQLIAIFRSIANYVYLRNFSDSIGVAMVLDNSHWMPSSVVNAELSQTRGSADAVDKLVENSMSHGDGNFNGSGWNHHGTFRELLKKSGFTDTASWEKIYNLRRDGDFQARLSEIESCFADNDNDSAVQLLYDHVSASLSYLMNGRFKTEEFLVGTVTGTVGGVGAGAFAGGVGLATVSTLVCIGFVAGGGGAALYLGGRYLKRRRRQAILYDGIAESVSNSFQLKED